MQEFLEIWNKICESNLFNFVVMLLLLGWMIKKFDLGQKIEDGRKKIENAISDSERARDESLNKLYEAQDAVTKIDEEMFKVFKTAEDNARVIGEKMIEEGNVLSEAIKENSKKAIEANAKTVKGEVVKDTAEQAMKMAEEHIKAELERDPNLHQRYINESIDAIDGIGVNI